MINKNSTKTCDIEEVTWADVRNKVSEVNADLFSIIEQIDPDKSFKLIKVRYQYGAKITDLGKICVPDKLGRLARLDDVNVSEKLKKQLSYGPTPLILQLNNASEVFIETEDRIIPLNVFNPGDLYGLFEAIVPLTGSPISPCWSVTAGGRSVFFAAKITDAICHKRLRAEFGLHQHPPKTLMEHWSIFKALNKQSASPWQCEILLFTGDWLKKRDDDINWLRFHNYLLTRAWIQSKNTRVKSEYSAMWESFSSAICARHLKPGPYIVNTVMHLMFLASNTIPGFHLTTGRDDIMPFQLIEDIYTNVYDLKDYAPIILCPHVLGSANNGTSIYYSLAYPTLSEGTPSIRSKPNIITEVRDAQLFMSTLQRVLKQQNNDALYKFMEDIKFDYYHSDYDKFGELKNSQDIPKDDLVIGELLNTKYKGKEFPAYGQFFRGCIRCQKFKNKLE